MVVYENVISSADTVEELEINEQSVIVRSGITHVEDPGTDDEPGFTGWKIDREEVYTKDEYIHHMAEKNKELEDQATDLQLALTEVYEMML